MYNETAGLVNIAVMFQEKVKMFSHRPITASDAEVIASFPQSKVELFYLFPKTTFPLQPEVILAEAESRTNPTAIVANEQVVGYGNFIQANFGHFCSIGNVIVNPVARKTGVASYLVTTLTDIAFNQFNSKYVRISCFNENTAGILLYKKLGFEPVEIDVRTTHDGESVDLIHMHKHAT
jgi:RimJ/RimL family protein N-acetyltransferase